MAFEHPLHGSFIMEIWKEIPGYEGIYYASNYGRIKSLKFKFGREHILKPWPNTKGYLQVDFWKGGKRFTQKVHRLILLTFMGVSDLQCNHLDCDKTNNRLDNLEYCTNRENVDHATMNGLKAKKLSVKMVQNIKQRLLNNERHIDIALDYMVVRQTISEISTGKTWSHIKLV